MCEPAGSAKAFGNKLQARAGIKRKQSAISMCAATVESRSSKPNSSRVFIAMIDRKGAHRGRVFCLPHVPRLCACVCVRPRVENISDAHIGRTLPYAPLSLELNHSFPN